jgi:hypothetical protein
MASRHFKTRCEGVLIEIEALVVVFWLAELQGKRKSSADDGGGLHSKGSFVGGPW